jgi:hypothetical protein
MSSVLKKLHLTIFYTFTTNVEFYFSKVVDAQIFPQMAHTIIYSAITRWTSQANFAKIVSTDI